MLCFKCKETFASWLYLARHIRDAHGGNKWSEEYLRKHGESSESSDWRSDFRRKAEQQREYQRQQEERNRRNWDDIFGRRKEPESSEPLQKQAINILAKLYKANVTEGEIQAIVNIAKRQAQKETVQ